MRLEKLRLCVPAPRSSSLAHLDLHAPPLCIHLLDAVVLCEARHGCSAELLLLFALARFALGLALA